MELTEKELNEFPIGTMLIYNKGYLIKTDCKENQKNWYRLGDDGANGWHSKHDISKNKFHKVKIPTTWGEYIPPKPILDDKEKEYLSAVIRPFRKRISKIEKVKNPLYKSEWIRFSLISDSIIDVSFSLPSFKAGTMYKGMELDREYSLDELRIVR